MSVVSLRRVVSYRFVEENPFVSSRRMPSFRWGVFLRQVVSLLIISYPFVLVEAYLFVSLRSMLLFRWGVFLRPIVSIRRVASHLFVEFPFFSSRSMPLFRWEVSLRRVVSHRQIVYHRFVEKYPFFSSRSVLCLRFAKDKGVPK